MLVFDFFNSMVSSNQLEATGYTFDKTLQQWENGTTILGNEDNIEFTVAKLHECEGIISMEGSEPSIVA